MIRTFPGFYDWTVSNRTSIRIYFPEPFRTGSLVNYMFFDEFPFCLRCFQEILFLRMLLVFIQKSNDRLCLYPPDPVVIHFSFTAFICQRMTVKSNLIYIFRKCFGNRGHLFFVMCIPKYLYSTIHQPCCLNVMTIRIQINDGVVVLVKEYFLSLKFRIVYLIRKYIHNPL